MLVSVEDIEGERDPGLVYAVFLNLPDDSDEGERQMHHIGNVSFFGISMLNDPDEPHRGGAPALRYSIRRDRHFDCSQRPRAMGP